jgi:hypothetical protein
MTATIHLRHLCNSSLAGQSHALTRDEVRLGRRPDNDVLFDPELDRTVSGFHCRIYVDAGQLYVADAGSRNGTYVNGRRIDAPTRLSDSDRIMLGDRGPVLSASLATKTNVGDAPGSDSTTGESVIGPATVVGAVQAAARPESLPETVPPPPLVRVPPPIQPPQHSAPVLPAGDGVMVSAVPVFAPAAGPFAMTPPPAAPPADRQPSRASQAQPAAMPNGKTSIGMNTLVAELDKAARRERKRVLALATPVLLMMVAGLGLLAWAVWTGRLPATGPTPTASAVRETPAVVTPTVIAPAGVAPAADVPVATGALSATSKPPAPPLATQPATPQPATAAVASTLPAGTPSTAAAPPPSAVASPAAVVRDWAEVLEQRKRSVYVVIRQSPGKEDRGVGTAWSVAPGVLATNAHVAESFLELETGETLIARSNNLPVSEVRIAGVKLHPGYLRFEKLWKAHLPIDPDTGKALTYPTPFDVALMTLSDDSRARQEPPLALANAAALAKVAEATELAYVGFPMESAAERGVNLRTPVAHVFLGHLTRKTDIFLAGGNPERANFLQYTMTVQGGASGSPVFDRAGNVVGLISGNDHAASGTGGRIAISGKAFGPRSDAVGELINQTAERNLAPYIPDWRTHFRERFEKARRAGKYLALAENRAAMSFDLQVAALRLRNQRFAYRSTTVAQAKLVHVSAGAAGEKEVIFNPVPDAGTYCVVVTTDDPDLIPDVALPGRDDNLRAAPDGGMIVRGRLGHGTPSVASIAVKLAAGDVLRAKVSGTTLESGAAATVRVQLFQAVE